MKKIIFILGIITPMVFGACSQDDEQIYSCDKYTDNWAKANLSELQVMNRESWLQLPERVNLAAFRAMLPSKKVLFWKQKFEEVKKLKWTNLELQHIQKAENFLITNKKWIFAKKLSNEDLDKIDSFFYSWQKYAKEKLNWDQAVIYGIVGTGYPMMDKEGTLKINKEKRLSMADNLQENDEIGGNSIECHCKEDHVLACFPLTQMYCEKSHCDKTNTGCGWLFTAPCDGTCGGY
ncbi:UNVERIFIED_CONTAM: bacteriocin fulvocin C-related protein [Prevotella sp. 15_C9]